MKVKDGLTGFSAGFVKTILANKTTLFFCWIGLLVLFVLIVLHKGYQEWWFWPLMYVLGIAAFIFLFVWWWPAKHQHLKWQSFVGWLMIFSIFPGSIIALVLWGDQWWFQLIIICCGILGLISIAKAILRSKKKKWLRYTAVGLIVLFFTWLWGRELMNLIIALYQWLGTNVPDWIVTKWIVYYFKYIIFALITNAPAFAPVFIMLGLILFVIYHIINLRRRVV